MRESAQRPLVPWCTPSFKGRILFILMSSHQMAIIHCDSAIPSNNRLWYRKQTRLNIFSYVMGVSTGITDESVTDASIMRFATDCLFRQDIDRSVINCYVYPHQPLLQFAEGLNNVFLLQLLTNFCYTDFSRMIHIIYFSSSLRAYQLPSQS